MDKAMLKKGDVLELQIEDIHYDGCGVASWNGQKIFVEQAVTGDEVEAEVVQIRSHQVYARITVLKHAGPHRVVPPCAHFGRCGGCLWQHVDASLQKAHRISNVRQLFHAAHISWDGPIEAAMIQDYNYRRRARLSVKYDKKKDQVYVGFREHQGRYVADVRLCSILVEPEWPERLRVLFASLSVRQDIPQVDYARGMDVTGLVVRMLAVPTQEDLSKLVQFVEDYPGMRLALQLTRKPILLEVRGSLHELLFSMAAVLSGTYVGDEFLLPYQVGDCVMYAGPFDFVQIHEQVSSWMLVHVMKYLCLKPQDRVLDLFSGLGAFACNVAPKVAWVKGIELAESMVARAQAYAQQQGMNHVFFEAANLFAPPEHVDACDVLIVDPPRSGMEHLEVWVERSGADRIAYISCHAATLVRDIAGLLHSGRFQIERVVVMDMFAQTKHMEVMVFLKRKD